MIGFIIYGKRRVRVSTIGLLRGLSSRLVHLIVHSYVNYLECVILIPSFSNNTRTRFLQISALAFYFVRCVRASRHEQVFDNLATRFSRRRLQQSALRDVELHCFGRRHYERVVVIVGKVGGEEPRGAVGGCGWAGESATGAGHTGSGVTVGFGGRED